MMRRLLVGVLQRIIILGLIINVLGWAALIFQREGS
jgi:hypothetical protein